jgi:succinyl-CoA synthetase beta subunit
MNIHEYQAKELLAKFGISVPAGHAATSVEDAVAAAGKLPGPLYVVKAQIHAGGRGKGKFKELSPDAKGGVRLADSVAAVEDHAREMLGNTLVTIQTGDAGKQVNRLYVTDGVDIAEEYYLALLVDRATGRIAMIVSTEGGMSIEDVAHETPEKITTITIDPATGFMPHHGRSVAFALELKGDLAKAAQKLAKQLYEAFVALDCAMLEINPLVETKDGEMLVLDTKMSFDTNALFRHPDVEAMRDETEEDPMEVEASKHDLAYIKLDGDIGCMVNGAGLAMATMDIIKLNGAFPANFLDVGGGANREKVQDHSLRPGRQRHPGQHLRRHHALRHDRRRHRGGGPRSRSRRAAGRPPGRHQSAGRQGHPRQLRPADHPGRGPGRRSEEDRRRGEAGGLRTLQPSLQRFGNGLQRAGILRFERSVEAGLR